MRVQWAKRMETRLHSPLQKAPESYSSPQCIGWLGGDKIVQVSVWPTNVTPFCPLQVLVDYIGYRCQCNIKGKCYCVIATKFGVSLFLSDQTKCFSSTTMTLGVFKISQCYWFILSLLSALTILHYKEKLHLVLNAWNVIIPPFEYELTANNY